MIKQMGLVLLLVSLFACSETTQKNVLRDTPNNWKTINGTDYTIQYPDSFDLNTSGQMGLSFSLLSKQVSPEDLFRENINLIVQDLAGQSINLDEYVKISENQMKQFITNANLIESKRVKGNPEFHKIIYTGVQGQFDLKFEQYYWVIKNKAYVLTLTCESDQFDNYKDVGEKIMNSFEIK